MADLQVKSADISSTVQIATDRIVRIKDRQARINFRIDRGDPPKIVKTLKAEMEVLNAELTFQELHLKNAS